MTSRNPAGRTPSTHCRRGHDMSVWRRRKTDGNPYCLACKRDRQRVGMNAVARAAQLEELVRDGLSTTSVSGFRAWQVRAWTYFGRVEADNIDKVLATKKAAS